MPSTPPATSLRSSRRQAAPSHPEPAAARAQEAGPRQLAHAAPLLPRAHSLPGHAGLPGNADRPPRAAGTSSSRAAPRAASSQETAAAPGGLQGSGGLCPALQPLWRSLVRQAARLTEEMRAHPAWTAVVLDTLRQPELVGAMAAQLATAAQWFSAGVTALPRQLAERGDQETAWRIAQALVQLDGPQLAEDLIGEAVYGTLRHLPDHQLAGLQLLAGLGMLLAYWQRMARQRDALAAEPAPGQAPAQACTPAGPAAGTLRRSLSESRAALSNSVAGALTHAAQGVMDGEYAAGVAQWMADEARRAASHWFGRSRSFS
ncbi:hypothetical protein QRO08_04350 [Paracidovorax citrulli]|uniref:Uncharacterized protein n=1 Tax=Paracidovorax citrulli TaxID=80869 RepID=A0ABY9ASL4_PARCI|nr:hypothetical protein [Paracidovorax citrulli]PVY63971.1 hypothetical protein C8E08_1279 [Paracidovorax citrulli]REG67067.1 hypothetical protein C8E07_0114 [Paracidovorax citrulli]RLJ91627.1 hypothetical protein C8E06_0115 [Paracidovorax citrulli]UMT82028.1 hypothetical protein FRC75_00595 [Paracidovorax citrulli]WIY30254.1 hypothetical protein QRO09_00565 [Paracidovorax citrulli]